MTPVKYEYNIYYTRLAVISMIFQKKKGNNEQKNRFSHNHDWVIYSNHQNEIYEEERTLKPP